MKYEKICCGVDFSKTSHRALEEAAALAAAFDAELTLVHVHVELPPAATDLIVPPSHVLEEAATELREAIDVLRRDAEVRTGRPVKVAILEGQPADEIVRYARRHGMDLIVVGSHGRSGVRRLVLGSVTERLLRLATAPVLVVGPRAAERDVEAASENDEYALG
jgi:universal stress protein A